jgi:hypothetical protein
MVDKEQNQVQARQASSSVAVSNDTESCGGPQADTDCKID